MTQTTLPPTASGYDEPAPRRLGVAHLVMGLVFLGVVTTWALLETNVIQGADLRIVLPLVLVLAGAIGLVASIARAAQRRREASPRAAGTEPQSWADPEPWADDQPSDPEPWSDTAVLPTDLDPHTSTDTSTGTSTDTSTEGDRS